MNQTVLVLRVVTLAPLFVLAGCVTDANRCLPGYQYAPQYDACLQLGDAGAALVADGATLAEAGEDAPDPDDSGLGVACADDTACSGRASYCLKDPTAAPTDPGICSIPGCTAADCTSGYSCCDCTAALISALQAWPANVCAPASNDTTLVSFGCKCQ